MSVIPGYFDMQGMSWKNIIAECNTDCGNVAFMPCSWNDS